MHEELSQAPFLVKLTCEDIGVLIVAEGGTQIEFYKHKGEYYKAIRTFAIKIKAY